MPQKTDIIFEKLSKGGFICSNSSDPDIYKLYNIIDARFDDLYEYFQHIGFVLERDDEFFYFSKKESKVDLERKIKTFFRWIDVFDFFKTYDSAIDSGYRFSIADIHAKLSVEANLKNKLEKLSHYTKTKNYIKSLQKLAEMLCKEGFAELENEMESRYKILSSFKYLEKMIMNINLPEEATNEIPE